MASEFVASNPVGESVPVLESTLAAMRLSGSKPRRRRALIPRVVLFRVDGVGFAAGREDEAHARWV